MIRTYAPMVCSARDCQVVRHRCPGNRGSQVEDVVYSPRVDPICVSNSVVTNVIVGEGLLHWLGDVTDRNARFPGRWRRTA
jgi:hypothetical protein